MEPNYTNKLDLLTSKSLVFNLQQDETDELTELLKQEEHFNTYSPKILQKMSDLIKKEPRIIFTQIKKPPIKLKLSDTLEFRPLVGFEQEYYFGQWNTTTNCREGIGLCIFPDGRVYQGLWESDYPNGEGIIVNPDCKVYKGWVRNGIQHGKGIQIAFWGRCEGLERGRRIDQDLGVTGIGVREKYEGDFLDGMWEGFGSYQHVIRGCYEGEFKENRIHGYGHQICKNGDQYFGYNKSNKKNGFGVFLRPDGRIFEGQWHDGYPETGTFTDTTGKEYKSTNESKDPEIFYRLYDHNEY
ncbi:unnamed protein product [Moneuplotes crassus]|uniref:MORN repeat protein n=1 Tax=Euplotes crassus TaxID=5936 RepID=A0AAD1XK07_EUPCR|nr:unnamed protein product [Moneuplotes crassus]